MSHKLKKTNIVITLNSPLTENIYSRIGINHLNDYFEITLIDCLDYFLIGMIVTFVYFSDVSKEFKK